MRQRSRYPSRGVLAVAGLFVFAAGVLSDQQCFDPCSQYQDGQDILACCQQCPDTPTCNSVKDPQGLFGSAWYAFDRQGQLRPASGDSALRVRRGESLATALTDIQGELTAERKQEKPQ